MAADRASAVILAPRPGIPTSLAPPVKNSGPQHFVHDVALVVAEDDAPGRRHGGEGEAVRRRAGGDHVDADLALEEVAEPADDRLGGVVIAVAEARAAIRG